MRILFLNKRQYTNKDLLDDRFGRVREIPYHLARLGHSVEGLCLSYQYKSEGFFADGSVCWYSINLDRLPALGMSRFIRQASVLLRNNDILCAGSDACYGWIGWLLARVHRKPLLFDLYDNFEYFLSGKLPGLKHLYRWAVKNADVVTCVSNPLADLVRSYGRSLPVHVLENAVRQDLFVPMDKAECRRRLGLPRRGFLVGTAGDIGIYRGSGTLLEAFRRLKLAEPDLHLVLAGKKSAPLPTDERIHYLGMVPQEQVPVILNALDVAVVCLRANKFGRYCFPQKAREIMACGVPMVAARVGAMQTLLERSPERLYTPGDPVDLCRALKHCRQDPHTAYPPPVSWADIAEQLHGIIQHTLGIGTPYARHHGKNHATQMR